MIEQESDILKEFLGRMKQMQRCVVFWNPREKKEFQERESDEHVSNAAEGSRKMRTQNYSLILSKMEIIVLFTGEISMEWWG